MDNHDQQQAELDKEQEHADDIAYELIRILGKFGKWSDLDRATGMTMEDGLLTVEINLSSEEMQAIGRYLHGSKSMKWQHMIRQQSRYLAKKIYWDIK